MGHHRGSARALLPDEPAFYPPTQRAARLARRAALAAVSAGALLLGALPAAAQGGAAGGALPSLGEAGEMTPLEERKLGDAIAASCTATRTTSTTRSSASTSTASGVRWRAPARAASCRPSWTSASPGRSSGARPQHQRLCPARRLLRAAPGLVGVVRSRDELASVLGTS
jgi:hypothetical protein